MVPIIAGRRRLISVVAVGGTVIVGGNLQERLGL
jgi:hypothetical protein